MVGRGNGLHAVSYKPLIDLDPQLADAMLDALRDEGVAAYAAPAVTGADLAAQAYSGPLDRLWVDAEARDHANAVLETRLPGLRAHSGADSAATPQRPGGTSAGEDRGSDPGLDEEQAWAEIVAAFEAVPGDPVPRWPVAEDVEDRRGPGRPADRTQDGPSTPGAGLLWPSRGDLIGPMAEPSGKGCCGGGCGGGKSCPCGDPGHFDQDIDELKAAGGATDDTGGEHFVPPAPPPLPELDAVAKFAWVAALGGPLYFVLAALLGWQVTGWVAVLAVGAFIGGFATLVGRMNDRRSSDDPDDGAVV